MGREAHSRKGSPEYGIERKFQGMDATGSASQNAHGTNSSSTAGQLKDGNSPSVDQNNHS